MNKLIVLYGFQTIYLKKDQGNTIEEYVQKKPSIYK
jgi:hypothetical protein